MTFQILTTLGLVATAGAGVRLYFLFTELRQRVRRLSTAVMYRDAAILRLQTIESSLEGFS